MADADDLQLGSFCYPANCRFEFIDARAQRGAQQVSQLSLDAEWLDSPNLALLKQPGHVVALVYNTSCPGLTTGDIVGELALMVVLIL
jgi:hypothetical protein